MISKNLIRIDDTSQSIYRIFSVKRFLELIENKELVLVRPRKWEDPFENFMLECLVQDENGKFIGLKDIADKWYGQCWTYESDSDAMWRIYSSNKDGIRVKTTINKLAEVLWEPSNSHSSSNYFIGSVQYLSRDKIEEIINKTSFWDLAAGGQNDNFAQTLLMKHEAFIHEKELRSLAFDGGNNPRANGDLFKIEIDPNTFIDEVCIDPRLLENEAKDLKNVIQQSGYKGAITQSELYKISTRVIKLN